MAFLLPGGLTLRCGSVGTLQMAESVNQGDSTSQAGLDAEAWLKTVFNVSQQSCHLNRN